MGLDWGSVMVGAAIGTSLLFGLDRVAEGLKNIGFEERDIKLEERDIELKLMKVRKNDSPPPLHPLLRLVG